MLDTVVFRRVHTAARRFAGANEGNIAILFGIVAIAAGVLEISVMMVAQGWWKLLHAVLTGIFIVTGIVTCVTSIVTGNCTSGGVTNLSSTSIHRAWVRAGRLTSRLTVNATDAKGTTVTAFTFNGTVPGPMIRVTEGDQVKVIIKNELPVPTTIHWHGVEVPNAMDGVPGVTQEPIQPGDTFTYEFIAKPAGTFMYHSHFEGDVQVSAGLYAPFIIDPKEPEANPPVLDKTLMISESLITRGQTFAPMPMSGMEPNFFTINGKSFPATETITVKKGDLVRLRFIAIGQFIHPMHLHGVPFKIVATDGHPVPEAAQLTKDTVSVAPGERYDIEFIATETGQWMLHCHILHHTTNDNVEPGGLMLMINVVE